MPGACAIAAPSPLATSISSAARSRLGLRVSCLRPARSGRVGRARFSRDTNGAEYNSKGPIPQLYYGRWASGPWAAIKYVSVLLPDITRPNIVQALLMVSLPVVAAVLILLKLSSSED